MPSGVTALVSSFGRCTLNNDPGWQSVSRLVRVNANRRSDGKRLVARTENGTSCQRVNGQLKENRVCRATVDCGASSPRNHGENESSSTIMMSKETGLSQNFEFPALGENGELARGLDRKNVFRLIECAEGDDHRNVNFTKYAARLSQNYLVLEKTGLSQTFQPESTPKIQVKHACQRRPYRWWKARACISENNAWGKRMQSHDVRIALAVQDEETQMLHNAMQENRKTITWDPVLAEQNKL